MDHSYPAPDGQHFLCLYAINEERSGTRAARALWLARDDPKTVLGTISRLPVMAEAHWINDRQFAIKLNAHHRDWIRPMVVIDLAQGFHVLDHSNDPGFDLPRLHRPAAYPFTPFSEAALAVATDLSHLL